MDVKHAGREIEPSGTLGELSRMLIMGEGIYYLKRVRNLFISLNPVELSQFLLVVDHYLFKSILYYLQLFRGLPEIRDPGQQSGVFETLEKIIIYLYYNFMVHEKPTDVIFDANLPPLTQERYLKLLLETRHISRDHRICLNIIAKLDERHLDLFVNSRENAIGFLGEMIREFPESMLRDFLYQNPELFGYLKLFFMYSPQKDEEVIKLLLKHEEGVREAVKTLIIARKYSDVEPGAKYEKRDPKRIVELINELKRFDDVESAISLISKKGGFRDETEKQIVKNILMNPHFNYILDAIPDFSDEELSFFEGEDLTFF